MSADGEPGGVLIVTEFPGRAEDGSGRPAIGSAGAHVRRLVSANYQGPVAYDNAVRCAPGKVGVPGPDEVKACRGYLHQTILEVKPERIIALGPIACLSLLNRIPDTYTTRKGYAYLATPSIDQPTPVFFTLSPTVALRNRFLRSWFDEDITWALTCDPAKDAPPPPWRGRAKIVRPDVVMRAVRELRAASWFAFDVETAGLMFESPESFEILSFAACAEGSDDAWVWDRTALADPACTAPLRALLKDPAVKKVGANVKYDNQAIRWAWGVEVANALWDIRLWRKLIDAEASGALADMADLVGMGGMKEDAERVLEQAKKNASKQFKKENRNQLGFDVDTEDDDDDDAPRVPRLKQEFRDILHARVGDRRVYEPEKVLYAILPDDIIYPYNGRDAVATARLTPLLLRELDARPGARHIWDSVVRREAWAVAWMEWWGVPVSRDKIENLTLYLEGQMAEVRRRFDAYDKNFDPAKDEHVRNLLFKKLKLKGGGRTDKTGVQSTRADILEKLVNQHPVVADILEYRSYAKLKSTYADGLLPHIRKDGRIHTTILLDGARSGRPSSKTPNLFNLPKVDEDNPDATANLVKACFEASPGHVIVQVDLSQAELRVAAKLSEDQVMRDIFASGIDYHLQTAKIVGKRMGLDPDTITKKHPLRQKSKVINFLILYGGGDAAAAAQIGCSVEEAKEFRATLFGEFKQLAKWIKECLAYARKHGGVYTWWDGKPARWSPLWRIADPGQDNEAGKRRSKAEHGAVNRRVQGTAVEFCNNAIATMVEAIVFDGLPARLILTVYDSLIFEVPREHVEEVANAAREAMTGYDVEPRLKADVDVGPDLGNLIPLEEWLAAEKNKVAAQDKGQRKAG